MRREDIQKALEAACVVSNHHEFVVAGSLCVLGLIETPPERMSMSIDIDFYPLRDPGRASDIASVLGEDSDFHARHGYYLDAVSPELPVLPDGWSDRLVPIKLGQMTAYFLDVNDTAVSKYARGALNDFRWLEAGYEEKILTLSTIEKYVRFSTTYFDDDDRRKTNNGLLMHRIAIQPDGSLSHEMLEYLHENLPVGRLREVDQDHGEYSGPILWANSQHAIQSLGRSDTAVHDVRAWPSKPEVGDETTIRYREGNATLEMVSPERDRDGPSFKM